MLQSSSPRMGRRFLALLWPQAQRDVLAPTVLAYCAALEGLGWRRAGGSAGSALFLGGGSDLDVHPIGRDLGVVIGDVFARGEPVGAFVTGFDEMAFERLCGRLTADHWGRYVAIRWPTASQAPAVFRDPSGSLDCATWAAGGVRVIASDLPEDLPAALRPNLAVDWNRIASIVADPARVSGALAFEGIRSLWPGEVWYDERRQLSSQMWLPAVHANPCGWSDQEVRTELVRRVEKSVQVWLSPARGTLVEVSGGLDSAIVAMAAARRADHGVRTWLNYRGANHRSDERLYARAVADRVGFKLTEVEKPIEALDTDAWRRLAGGLRAPLNAAEPYRDGDVARRCASGDIATVLTGQGGDVVFFQEPTHLVVADLIQSGAPAKAVLKASDGVARWTAHSGWSTLFEARAAAKGGRWRSPFRPSALVTEECVQAASINDHPWLKDVESLPPAKRLQVEALVACQSFYGDCASARTADVIHPLLAQPVVELCLSIPTFDLTRCRRDRALARESFADRLPAIVTERRAKGEFSSHYGRNLAASLDRLRPQLMDGELVKHGLLDRGRLEQALRPEALILTGSYFEIVSAALVEIWVADWVSRLG